MVKSTGELIETAYKIPREGIIESIRQIKSTGGFNEYDIKIRYYFERSIFKIYNQFQRTRRQTDLIFQ